jgi:hypothetical protein
MLVQKIGFHTSLSLKNQIISDIDLKDNSMTTNNFKDGILSIKT